MREDWIECQLEDMLDYIQPSKYIVDSTNYHDDYKTPVLTAGKSFIIGYTDEKHNIFTETPVIIFDDFTTATKFVNFNFKVKSSAMKILKPTSNIVNIDYVYYFIQTINENTDTHKRYWISIFSQLPIKLPPLSEQRAIVSKLESLFSELDKGIENIQKAQQQLEIYRQAVLKKAFEGGYTSKKLEESKLPKEWKLIKLRDICDMKAGFFIKASQISKDYKDNLFPCYGGNGLRGYVESMTHEGTFPIVGRQGALCGNVHLVNGKFHATEHAVVVKAKNNIDTKCLYYKLLQMRLNQYSTGTAQPGLSVNKVVQVETIFPLNLQEQKQIVQEIESRLSVCDKLNESITESLEKAESLRQSILKKAFEGKLLTSAELAACKKEADYEPAQKLLERIQAEKVAQEKAKKSTKKTRKKSVKK